MPDYAIDVTVKLGGTQLAEEKRKKLLRCRVESTVNAPSAFELTFADQDRDLLARLNVDVGAPVEIMPYLDGKPGDTIFTGELTSLVRERNHAREHTLVLRGYDEGHRLTRHRRVVAYRARTASDIVRQVAREYRIKVGTVDPTGTPYEQATQPNVSDWEFLTRLAVQNGVDLFLDATGKLQFTARASASSAPRAAPGSRSPFVLSLNDSRVHRCRIDVTSTGLADQVRVRGWDVERKKPITGAAPGTTMAPGVRSGPSGRPRVLNQPFRARSGDLVETGYPFTTQRQVESAAKAIAEDVSGSSVEVEVELDGTPELAPGVPVTVADAGKPFDGQYTVTTASHVFEPGNRYSTRIEVTGRQVRNAYGLATGATTAAPSLPGVANAVVEDVQDTPERRGRVKLSFPWLDDDYTSDWCRVAQFGGAGGGGLNLPNVGDEVLVAFDRGSLEHPYVIAGLYNGVDTVPQVYGLTYPASMSGEVQWRSVASREGHRMELIDRGAGTGLRLRTGTGPEGQTIHLNETTRTVTVASPNEVVLRMGPADVPSPFEISLSKAGTVITGPVKILGQVTVVGQLGVALETTLGGELSVAGVSAFGGAVSVTGAATVNGATVLNGALAANGAVSIVPPLINGLPVL